MHQVIGHLGGMPAEEVIAGLAPVSAMLVMWMRVGGRRLRDRIAERRDA